MGTPRKTSKMEVTKPRKSTIDTMVSPMLERGIVVLRGESPQRIEGGSEGEIERPRG